MHCLEFLKSLYTSSGALSLGEYDFIRAMRFLGHGSTKVAVHLRMHTKDQSERSKVFVRSTGGQWRQAWAEPEPKGKWPTVYIREGLNEPPVVMVRDPHTNISRAIWNPNPQLEKIALGEVTPYHWTDASGQAWTGGLYKPTNYAPGKRYPLVIQTHGFIANEFSGSGAYPTAFAARALAASGMLVLQVPLCPVLLKVDSGRCAVSAYGGAVRQLTSQGMIDPMRVGIIGFSYTVYDVLEALTANRVRFAAASVTDGNDGGYWQFVAGINMLGQVSFQDALSRMNGAKPFGAGLQLWLRHSPDFHMQDVHTPLLVNALGRGGDSLIFMWEPYALLHYLGKPVDLVVLNSNPYEHVLTEPAVRMASQGGTVDWFRFWLQGYESPNPIMPAEYRRWEMLCDMQIEENPGRPTWCVPRGGFRAQIARTGRSVRN